MEKLVIDGPTQLSGAVEISGAKNAALPMMAASLAIGEPVTLRRIPDLLDVRTMIALLQSHGAEVKFTEDLGTLRIDSSAIRNLVASEQWVTQMRAGICVLGPLLARFGTARVALPGGCRIGHRPVDLHLRGLAALGADLRIDRGYIVAEAGRLQGTELSLLGPHGSSVTATTNVLAAAVLAQGRTVIHGAAREPEVVDLGRFLQQAGAKIDGLGSSVIEVHGVEQLQAVDYRVCPDRIEAATFAIAAAATSGRISICGVVPDHLRAITGCLQSIGCDIQIGADSVQIAANGPLRPHDVVAEPFPGIPTDTQAQLLTLLCLLPGESTVTDNVFPDRFQHVDELSRLGASIRRFGNRALIRGGNRLSGASVVASDLRASAALVIAGLVADGTTQVRHIHHLDRGYERLETKLNALGAQVQRCEDEWWQHPVTAEAV